MQCSKFQLSARMKRKNLLLDEKMKVTDYANKNPKIRCWVIAEHFSIGKTYVQISQATQKRFKGNMSFSKETVKKTRYGQYHLINKILIAWYKKCYLTILFPDVPMLKEEVILKERLNKVELATFTASNGWLEKFKQRH